jgi:hypothetical protein
MIKPLYKAVEPFMEVKRGYGYQGIVLHDDVNDTIQCHLCGKFFDNLGQHIWMKHKTKSADYKIEYGLTLRTPLCSTKRSNNLRQIAEQRLKEGTLKPAKASDAARMANRNKKHNYKYRRQGSNMLLKNRNGLCELQIKYRYDIVSDIVKRIPMQSDILKYDRKLFYCGIVPNYGNLNNFRESIKVKSMKWEDYSRITKEKLIAELRKIRFDEHKLPKTTMFMNGNRNEKPSLQCYYRNFGSWSNALRMAGLK